MGDKGENLPFSFEDAIRFAVNLALPDPSLPTLEADPSGTSRLN